MYKAAILFLVNSLMEEKNLNAIKMRHLADIYDSVGIKRVCTEIGISEFEEAQLKAVIDRYNTVNKSGNPSARINDGFLVFERKMQVC